MDNSPTASSRSYIPRPSRIPRAAPSLRPSISRDFLRTSTTEQSSTRLRATQSRDQLSTPSRLDRSNQRGEASQTPSKPSPRLRSDNDGPFKKPLLRDSTRQQTQSQAKDQLLKDLATGLSEEQSEKDTVIDSDAQADRAQRSLSERTMETLSQIPASPVPRSRRSSFFNPESPMRPPSRTTNGSRPGSSYQTDAMMGPPSRATSSRPGSSMGYRGATDFRSSVSSFKPLQLSSNNTTPAKRPSTAKSLKTPKSTSSLRTSSTPLRRPPSGFLQDKSPSPVKTTEQKDSARTSILAQSKTLRPRASVIGLPRKPSVQGIKSSSDKETSNLSIKKRSPTLSNTSSDDASIISKASKDSFISSATSIDERAATPRKSSAALREQIAKAKAAKRAEMTKNGTETLDIGSTQEAAIVPSDTFDFGLSRDPFNLNKDQNTSKGLLKKRIDAARKDGRLNIAAMGLKEIPPEVINMYNLEEIGGNGSDWAESVDLTRFIAADNEIAILSDEIFPDDDPQQFQYDDDAVGNQFGALETLGLHGNLLTSLPLGLRRLQLLTTLNLSNNKLEDGSFDIIYQLPSLRDLKIGNNSLSGDLSPNVAKMRSLEVLDLQRNSITALPDSISELKRLRVLNVMGNAISSLPMDALRTLPLIELVAAKNKLQGALVSLEEAEFSQLQVLDITANSLTSLSTGMLHFPALHQLNCSANRLTHLPDMGSWKSLLTLTAEDNCVESIPAGFTTLAKLKHVDFTGNNIKILDERIGQMDNLDILRISANPLKDKKFASMSTEDLKRNLKARLTPDIPEPQVGDHSDGDTPFSTPPSARPSAEWTIKLGGILERSHTDSHSLNPVIVSTIAAGNVIRGLQLHHNAFKEIPSSIAFFADSLTSLNMSHNELASDTYLKDEIVLPGLKELNLSSNTIDSLNPLTQRLKVPNLEKLDISFNRVISLPPLQQYFPRLNVLLASHNTIRELLPESIKGLKVVDCSSNEISSLNARIGLLGGPGGLELLDVKGNRFRVPKYTILEKGTEAVLAWLRDKIPASENPYTDTSPDDVD